MSLYSSNIYHSCEKKEKRRRGKKITVYNIYGRFCLPILPSSTDPLTSHHQATDFTSRGRGGPRWRGRPAPAVSLPPSALAA